MYSVRVYVRMRSFKLEESIIIRTGHFIGPGGDRRSGAVGATRQVADTIGATARFVSELVRKRF